MADIVTAGPESGKEFDSSYKRGEATSFPVNGVIKGFAEGISTMKVGTPATSPA